MSSEGTISFELVQVDSDVQQFIERFRAQRNVEIALGDEDQTRIVGHIEDGDILDKDGTCSVTIDEVWKGDTRIFPEATE